MSPNDTDQTDSGKTRSKWSNFNKRQHVDSKAASVMEAAF